MLMKKFSLMILVAFMAAVSWAQPKAMKAHRQLPEQFIAKTAATVKMVPEKKEMAPRLVPMTKMQAPAKKYSFKKSPAKVKKVPDLSELLTTYMVKSYTLELENQGTSEEPDYQLVPASIFQTTQMWEISLVDATNFTLGITGIYGGDQIVQATVDVAKGTITIPYGQAVGTSSYGTLGIASMTGAESLVGTLEGDEVVFDDYWCINIIDGSYAGYRWSEIFYSTACKPNGKMTYIDSNGKEIEQDVDVDVYADEFIATVWGFGEDATGVDVDLKSGGKFVIKPQLVYESTSYGDFYTSGITNDNDPINITGTGTENTLTFDDEWTCLSTTGYWYGKQKPATITFESEGEIFVYPELVEAPATPADPSVVSFTPWDDELGYATVTVNIPAVDVDDNDLITSLLKYQLYIMGEGEEAVALGDPIDYESVAENVSGTGDKKTVQLGEEAKDIKAIAVKSIYTALGETNESEMSEWFEIPELVTVPEGLELKEYPVTADARYSSGWETYTGTVKVGIDGEDFYVQGLLPHCPNGWAKGTISGTTVTLPSLQFMGVYSGDFIYLTAIDLDTYEATDITFEYIEDEDLYISEDLILGNIGNEDIGSIYYPYFDGMMLGTETVPELVELPEGAEVVQYPFMGNTYSSGSVTEFESTVNVAVVDNDVYVQGINEYAPEVWVKGTKDADGNVVFPTGQNFGLVEEEDYYGDVTETQYFFVGANASTGEIEDVVMTYNEEEDYYELQNEMLVNAKKSSIYYATWYMSGTTIGQKKTQVATFNFNEMKVATSNNAANDGDILEDTVIESGNVALTIAPAAEGVKTPNRFWGTKNGPQLRMYSNTLTFTTTDGSNITKIDFTRNGKWNDGNSADSGEFDGAIWTGDAQTVVVTIAANTQMDAIDVTSTVKMLPPLIETEAPEDLESSDWKLKATEIVYVYPDEEESYESRKEEGDDAEEEGTFEPEEYSATVQVGFYTVEGEEGTEVYIQGLCPELPDAWVKAPLVDGKVTIPSSTYFGEYEYIDWDLWEVVSDQMFLTAAVMNDDETYNLTDVVFNYDEEKGELSSEQSIFVNADRRTLYYYNWYEGMTITRIPDVAATPADPEIPEDGLIMLDTMYPKIKPIIKTVDVDGNDLLTSKLYYTIWIDNGTESQLTFTTDIYEELEEDMTEIPYEFGDGWDIYRYAETIYFNQGDEEIATWSRVGVQSIYYGGGERNTSNIVWADNPAYDETTGISNVNAETEKAVIFDLQGRRVAKAAKGLYIKNGKKVVVK